MNTLNEFFLDYIDYDRATKSILRDYRDMQFILDRDAQQLESIETRKMSITSRTDKPHVSGGGDGDALEAQIDKKSILEQSLLKAYLYNKALNPLIDRLSKDER
jgi:hypothetical protein